MQLESPGRITAYTYIPVGYIRAATSLKKFAPWQGFLQNLKMKCIAEKKAIRYSITIPNLFHSRFDFGHHIQHVIPASTAFGATTSICNQRGHSEKGVTIQLILPLKPLPI